MDLLYLNRARLPFFRYQSAYDKEQISQHKLLRGESTNREWQLIIKVDSCRNRRTRRCGHAYETKNLWGDIIFVGGSSSGAKNPIMAVQEALMEAVWRARELGYHNSIIILNGKRRLEQVYNAKRKPNWQGKNNDSRPT